MKQIVLTQGKVALVDDNDFEYLNQFRWYFSPYGYAARSKKKVGGKYPEGHTSLMHREIMEIKSKSDVDHINGDKLDNRKSNLRLATRSQNMINKDVTKRSVSGLKGVYWFARDKKWISTIVVNYKTIFLGYFKSKEKAARSYKEAAIKYFGEYAYGNI